MNMFARKQKTTTSQTDELNRKKCAGKVLDLKKDINSRLRYLKIYIESSDNNMELKQFFDANYSQIFFIFYESFVNIETTLKQKFNKINRDELESILFVFQKILLLQPERLHQRWQVRCIGRVIQKLLHIGNTKSIKYWGVRLFLIWYQILNVNKTHVEELMYQKLIQGFDTSVQLGGGILNSSIGIDMLNAEAQKVFNQYDTNSSFSGSATSSSGAANSVANANATSLANAANLFTVTPSSSNAIYPFEISYIVPAQPNEHHHHQTPYLTQQQLQSAQQQNQQQQQIEGSQQQQQLQQQAMSSSYSVYNITAEMLKTMLDYMHFDCLNIEWYGDKLQHSQRCYEFLFDEFKRFYLAYMFPSAFIVNNSLQNQQIASSLNVYSNLDLLSLLNEQQIPIMDRPTIMMNSNDERKLTQLHCKEEIIKWLIGVLLIETNGTQSSQLSPQQHAGSVSNISSSMSNSAISSSEQSVSMLSVNTVTASSIMDSVSMENYVNDYESTITSLDSLHSSNLTVSTVTANSSANNIPLISKQLIQRVILCSTSNVNLVHEILRNDYKTVQRVLEVYRKWFLKEAKIPLFLQDNPEDPLCLGQIKSLQIFLYHSCNLLLNRINLQREKILNICCYTLEIYKLFIRKIKMDNYTWTMLITILLKVSNFLFNSEYLTNSRNDSATSNLIKLTTETVLLAFIRASFTFNLGTDLWNELMNLLSSVSSNSDVIDKWIESIDDLIKQVIKGVYNIDINNLPIYESTLDNKRKYKNKKVVNNGSINTAISSTTTTASTVTSVSNNISNNNNNNTPVYQHFVVKPRAKTEIYSPAVLSTIGLNTPPMSQHVNQQYQQAINQQNGQITNTPLLNTNQNQLQNNQQSQQPVQQQNSVQNNHQQQNQPSQTSQQAPMLSRQRNMTMSGDIEPGKSPSLSEEHFLAINNNNKRSSSVNQFKVHNNVNNSPSSGSHAVQTASTPSTVVVLQDETSSPLKSVDDDDTDSLNNEKSATLKANPNNSSTSANSNKIINRFNSDKSIYYSSEVLADNVSNPNNTSIHGEDNDSNSSSNNSQFQNTSFTTPPPLPPMPKQSPPPLPPLPPSLASKYYLAKSIQINSSENSSIDQVDATTTITLNDRKLKGLSTTSGDLNDVFLKDYSGENVLTIDYSGDTPTTAYASPSASVSASASASASVDTSSLHSVNNDTVSFNDTNSSSLLLQTVQSMANNINNDSLNSTGTSDNNNIVENGSNPSVSRNADDRSASFIDAKYLHRDESMSRTSTLTANTTIEANTHAPLSTTASSRLQVIGNEPTFKETCYMLIKRLFGCLGNVNAIKDPNIHKRVFEFIYTKWERLAKIKDDLKLNDLSQIILPISYFSPWLFESIYELSFNYQSGKLIAYKILCRIVIRSSTNDFHSINDEFMDLFYLTIHQGLRSNNKSVINCIIENCGTKFWHCMLPSCTLLLKDFIDACSNIDNQGPKLEAASTLGCLIGFPDYFGDTKVLNQQDDQENLIIDFFTKEELKNQIIFSITNLNDECSNTNSRCVILCILTCFIYDEILNNRWHSRLTDAIKRIFKDLDFREQFNPVLVKMSCDNLRFLSILANLIFQKEIQYAINIINELNQCLVKLINTKPTIINEDYEKAIIANMFALLEWCMCMPLEQLKDHDRATLLRNNFKLIIHICNTFKPSESIESEHIHLSARFIITHLLNQLNHFPFGASGPSKIVSSVNETSDYISSVNNTDEFSTTIFEQPNIQFFTVNNQFLISFIELPMKNHEHFFNISPKLKTSHSICRFIVRDFCAKNCWDCCLLYSPDENMPNNYVLEIPYPLKQILDDESDTDSDSLFSFDYTKLPYLNYQQIPKNIDILDNILQYISYSSPECRLDPCKALNIVWDINPFLNNVLNVEDIKNKILNQSQLERKHTNQQYEIEMNNLLNKNHQAATNTASPTSVITNNSSNSNSNSSMTNNNTNDNSNQINSYFHLCKSFVHQMGLLSWEKRQSFNLLHKSSQLLRELKSLDDQTCRETHKIALIYIAEGQEDKMSILSNERGSQDYEDFLSALAWPVDLETHEGFMGGLQHNLQLKTAPYYANSICEVLFHVSTQMNNPNDQNKISKWRHLGNDSVQIIWSEHTKDYDRNILATEFADVLICIYPLRNGLYRIQITKKSSVGYFGPLFDGAIVNKQVLPTLIRATAINASRVLLSNTKGYQDFYVHRAHAINNIIKTLTEKQTSEQFIVDVYSPAFNVNPPVQQQQQQQQQPQVSMGSKKDNQDVIIN